MARVINSPEFFTIIGENIHTTRSVKLKGARIAVLDDGMEAVKFTGEKGEQRLMPIPAAYKSTQHYQQGQVKHFMVAVMLGLSDNADDNAIASQYIHWGVRRQVEKGAHFLDINVDEISSDKETQKKAMRWVVDQVQAMSPVPISVDSSNSEVIEVGLAQYKGRAGRPLVNSVALERLDLLDIVKRFRARTIVTSAGLSGMPKDADERVENVGKVIEAGRSKGIPLSDMYADTLAFPILVASRYRKDYLESVQRIREAFGPTLHVGGGLSNVSYGLPNRKLINDTFIYLGIEAGIDAGIIDPVQSDIASVFKLDTNSEPVKLAMDMLLGNDDFCVNYITAFREGRLGKEKE